MIGSSATVLGSCRRSSCCKSIRVRSVLMLQSVNDVNLAKFLDFDVPWHKQ